MTQTINIKAIIRAGIAAFSIAIIIAAIVFLSLAARHNSNSISVPRVQQWSMDTVWSGGWNRYPLTINH